MGYKRTIYDLTFTEELAEENEILDQETIIKREGTSEDEEEITEETTISQKDGNIIKRRRLNADDIEKLED